MVDQKDLGQVDVKIESEDGVAKAITWTWNPPDATVALILREALDPLLEAQNDKLGRDFRRQRRLSNYKAVEAVADGNENDSINGSGE